MQNSTTEAETTTSSPAIVKQVLAAVVCWWKAQMLNYPYWRVEYKDGTRTRLLYFPEAKGLSEVFNGRLYIDYNCR